MAKASIIVVQRIRKGMMDFLGVNWGYLAIQLGLLVLFAGIIVGGIFMIAKRSEKDEQ